MNGAKIREAVAAELTTITEAGAMIERLDGESRKAWATVKTAPWITELLAKAPSGEDYFESLFRLGYTLGAERLGR